MPRRTLKRADLYKLADRLMTQFALVPTIATAAMLVILLGLGTWQMHRLHWKNTLQATIDARIHAPVTDVMMVPFGVDQDYRPVSAVGILQNDHEMYMTAISREGAGGYHVLTPMKLVDGRMLLVDRGWIPYSARPRMFVQPEGRQTIIGVLRAPHHSWVQSTNHPDKNDWYHIDLKEMAGYAGAGDFMPYVLEESAAPGRGGLPMGGQTLIDLPNNHLQYALTWYALALILVVIYVKSLKRPAD